MEQVSLNTEHKKSTKEFPLVEVSYTFNAPVEKVWQAWTDPELIKQWWGPAGFSAPDAKNDLREGGKYLYAMKDLDGKVTWGTGTYLKIIPNKLLVCTDNFADEDGNIITPQEAGMPMEFGDGEEAYVTVEFIDQGDSTEIHLSHEGLPSAIHDDCLDGWTSSLDKMQTLLESH